MKKVGKCYFGGVETSWLEQGYHTPKSVRKDDEESEDRK